MLGMAGHFGQGDLGGSPLPSLTYGGMGVCTGCLRVRGSWGTPKSGMNGALPAPHALFCAPAKEFTFITFLKKEVIPISRMGGPTLVAFSGQF